MRMTVMAAEQHPSFLWPEDQDVLLWRYMDFSKFAALILKQELFFARASSLGDPFEGSLTEKDLYFREYILTNCESDERLKSWRNLSDEQIMLMNQQISDFTKKQRENFFVSCWHMNNHESMAMWSLYSRTNESIAIQSTFRKLQMIIPNYTHIGLVSYIDFEQDSTDMRNLFNPILNKRISFQHEREVLAVAWELLSGKLGGDSIRSNMTERGLRVPVKIEDFINCVYVHPETPKWFLETLRDFLNALKIPLAI